MSTENQTRKELIDRQINEAGWDVNNPTQVQTEFDITIPDMVTETPAPYGGHQFSDYVLLGKNALPVAVIEAKKTSKDASIGREQAKQYCENIQKQYGGSLPFCFYTNGLEIYFWDIGNYPPRKVYGYPTRDDLERMAHIREYKKHLADEMINTNIAGRDYQIRSIRAVMEGIQKKQRNFLLVMATGTGKTRTCIALVDALMKSGWVERTLFLVDRIALQEQALHAFKEHLPNEPRWPKTGEREISKDRRVYVSTYQTMINIIREKQLSPHFFDLVVIDESHRSIYNTYGEVIEYFKAINIGLTATPTDAIDHNTFKLFNCEDGLPTFAYTYEEAVNNNPPYLCDFEVMKIHTRFQDDGISKRTISLDDQMRLMAEGKEIEEINYEGTELEKTVINKGTNSLIVRQFMEECIKDKSGVLPGKTIFFCASMSHARRMEQIIDAMYPEHKGELAKVIVSDDPRVYGKGGLLDQFKNNDMPRIALSVDMLDTGIDIRELVNLVFAKPVFSYTKFWQMIGRGTRLLEQDKMKPWCTQKDKFLILDCWDNFEYFKINPKGKSIAQQIPLPVRFAGIRIDKIAKAIEKGYADISVKEVIKLRQKINELPENSIIIKEAATELNKISDDNFWVKLTPEKLGFLKNSIMPLFRTVSQVDFKSMRFEKDLLEASLARLSGEEEKYEALKDSITEIISELPLSVNIVAKHKELIEKTQSNNFWAAATDGDFDEVAEKLSALMKFRDGQINTTGPEKFDLKDEVAVKEMVEFGPKHEAVSVSRYKEMVEKLINQLTETNPILQKIKEGREVSAKEAEILAQTLHNEHPHITEELLKSVYRNRKAKLLQFIRHILGLEKLDTFSNTVSMAFDTFIKNHTYLSVAQLQFLDVLKNFILEKETLQKRDLIEAPFTILHPQGIRGVFQPSEIDEIVEFTKGLVN
ncbi:MAG: DEAD/DEAH box helicase family protein [Candidatus Goldbacteria bacterium]|nr:DEAD/DEAH box helicase family protein [Candidatus Goldiibacteriota bacterium]